MTARIKDRIYLALFAGGFLSIVAQLVFMREFLSVFYGSELVFGIILGNWLLLTALGSFLGRYSSRMTNPRDVLTLTLVALGVSFPSLVYFARTVGSYFSVTGEAASVQLIIASTFAILALFCVLNGLMFILCTSMLSAKEPKEVGKAYFIESIGSFAGGLTFAYFFAYFLDGFQASYLVCASYFACALALIGVGRRRVFILVMAVAVLFLCALPLMNLQGETNRMQYPGQEVVVQRNSLYGNIVVTRTGGQLNFFENGIPLFSTENTLENEESVHYAMIQRESPRDVLLVSGGVSGTLNEILKYGVDRLVYVEIDPALIDVTSAFSLNNSLDDDRVVLVNSDGRLFIKSSDVLKTPMYDVVLVNVHDPLNAQLNRYYTLEFFREVKARLKDGGVVEISLASQENYISPELRLLNSGVYWTLRRIFNNVIVIPGYRNYFLASDEPLSYEIGGLIREKGIKTEYVNDDYLKSSLTKERINWLLDSVKDEAEVNSDLRPIAYYRQISYWSRLFRFDYNLLAIVAAAVIAFFFIKLKPAQLSVFTVGFMGSAVEIALLIAYQIAFGSIYQRVGLLVASFMLGLALGAYYEARRGNSLEWVVLFASLLPLAASLAIFFVENQFAYGLLMALSGFVVGMAYPIAFRKSGDAGMLYGLDLAGAFAGSMLAGAFLIPTLGLINTCIIAGGLNALCWLMLKVKKQ